MGDSRIRQQVLAILENNGLHWTEQDGHYSLRFASALLVLSFIQLGTQIVISLRAPVLRNIASNVDGALALRRLNELNCVTHFGKWVFYEDERVIALEYDLLGNHLQEDELMTALTMLARLADQQDDILQQQLNGERSFESS